MNSKDYLDKIDEIIQNIKDENLFDIKLETKSQTKEVIKYSNTHHNKNKKFRLFSKASSLKQNLVKAMYPYFIHAGISDAITTVIALNMCLDELNPLVSMLFPTQTVFIPAILVAFAYGRALSAILLFQSKKHIKPMLWLTLYFPAIFNVINIIWFYFHMYEIF